MVAHAGLPEAMHGRASAAVRSFALYGDTTGETDEFGLPVRYPWAAGLPGQGDGGLRPHPGTRGSLGQRHDLHRHRLRLRRGADRAALSRARAGVGAGPGRALSARTAAVARAAAALRPPPPGLRPPRAARRPPPRAARGAGQLDVGDVLGKRIIRLRAGRSITIGEQNALAALEVMSRFAIDPRWLIYLPPTMAPAATSDRPGLLEHPQEAFGAYRRGRRHRGGVRGEAHGLAGGGGRLPGRRPCRAPVRRRRRPASG